LESTAVGESGKWPIHKGTEKKNAKLNDAAIIDIRSTTAHRSKDTPLTALAKKYNVSKKTIYDVIKNKSWKHVNPPPPHDVKDGE
jgi:DNA invertase Pin-like site-specific DNA recombinase